MKLDLMMNLPQIVTFDQLLEIQNKAAEKAIRLDLMFIRKFYFLADTCLFIIGADALDCLEFYLMTHNDYFNMTKNEKKYIKQYY